MAKRVKVKSVDLSCIGYRAGDFAANELDNLFAGEESIHGCVRAILDNVGRRPGIVYCPGISSAARTVEVFARYTGRSIATLVTGDTAPDTRRHYFELFGKSDSHQILVNVGVATEGTDLPPAAFIAMLRPTHSPGLFTQMLGRGLRPLCSLGHDSTREERQRVIAESSKPNCLVLDFVNVTGRHSVCTVADTVGAAGPVAAAVSDQIASGTVEVDVFQAVQEEEARQKAAKEAAAKRRKRDAEKRAAITGKVTVEVSDAELIGLGAVHAGIQEAISSRPITPGQAAEMTRLGIRHPPGNSTAATARKLILDRRAELGLASEKQVGFLRRFIKPHILAAMTFDEAKEWTKRWYRGRK